MLVITNNPKAKTTLEEKGLCKVEYLDVPLMDLFFAARDRIHLGHRLLTHPLSGSVKPNEGGYKSIGISSRADRQVDFASLKLIEQAIVACQKFPPHFPFLTDKLREDFQTVDLALILSVFQREVSV